MSYPSFDKTITSIGCPICSGEIDPRFWFCNYDCYVEGKKDLQSEQYNKEKREKSLFPILFNRDFKHIPPNNYKERNLRFDDTIKRWIAIKGDV